MDFTNGFYKAENPVVLEEVKTFLQSMERRGALKLNVALNHCHRNFWLPRRNVIDVKKTFDFYEVVQNALT